LSDVAALDKVSWSIEVSGYLEYWTIVRVNDKGMVRGY